MLKSFYALMSSLIILGCTNLFSTRADQVEKPRIDANPFLEADKPQNVEINFLRSVTELNLIEYQSLFPDPTILDSIPQIYRYIGTANFNDQLAGAAWGYAEEIIFASRLFTDNTIEKIVFSFENDPLIIQNDESHAETDFFKYNLSVTNFGNPARIYNGQMQLKFYRSTTENLQWYIYEWTDQTIEGEQPISVLKLEIFSQ